MATCASPLSRNHSLGVLLGQGAGLDEAITRTEGTAEGVKTSRAVAPEPKRGYKATTSSTIARDSKPRSAHFFARSGLAATAGDKQQCQADCRSELFVVNQCHDA